MHFQHWISAYGYFGIFFLLMLGIVGLPVPDETLLVFSGYLVFRGKLHPFATLIASFLGSSAGISISYLLGRLLGLQIVYRYGQYIGITKEQLGSVHDWFKSIGLWTLVVGYFVPGVRHFTAVAAGVSGLEAIPFTIAAYSGALVWVSTFLSLGYFFGDDWTFVLTKIHENVYLASFIFVTILLSYLIWRFLRKKRFD
jgi:membrane protein DedA with SNARE-associated domain